MSEIIEIPIDKIKVGQHDQRIKSDDDGIDELGCSIGRVGLIYPLIVHPVDDGYVLVEGHRRLEACRRMGFSPVRCYIAESGLAGTTEIAFAANFFRKDLSPVELAGALKDCLDNKVMTAKQLAEGFHRKEHWVHSMIAISNWPADILEAIHNEKMSVSAGSNLALVTDSNYREFLVRNAVEQGATARTTAAWLQAWRAFQPQEEAITAEPMKGQHIQPVAVPQAPCFCCSQLFEVNQMSHVPVCGACIQIIRQASISGAG